MFERFTERARQVIVLAQEEARELRHNYIGTEHILLGLLREDVGLAARVLESLGVTIEQARAQIVSIVGIGEDELSNGQIPFTPRAKKTLEVALREALSLGHNYIGTEHILLGLLRDDEGVAARILVDLDADADKVREEVMRMLHDPGVGRVSEPAEPRTQTRRRIDPAWLEHVGDVLDQLGPEIRGKLGRDPDIGDLLLVLACAEGSLPSRALDGLGIDLDALWGSIEQIRAQLASAQAETDEQITAARAAKEQAIEAQQFDRAGELRDRERELLEQQARARRGIPPPELLAEVRRRLGIPDTDAPPPAA